MILRSALTALSLLALASSAHADRFYFGNPGSKADAGAAQLNTIDGVLLKEENGMLTIRVEGGEMTIPKSLVSKIEKTDLTVANIETAEKAGKQKLADADKKRREVQAAEASAKKGEAPAAPAASSKDLRIVIDFQGLLPNYVFKTFDPVLDRVNVAGLAQVIERYLREEIEKAAGRK